MTEEGIQWICQEMNKIWYYSGQYCKRSCIVIYIDNFWKKLLDNYVRPIGKMLFPDSIGHSNDVETYPFMIRYILGKDVKLNEHHDASVVTININLNLPGEDHSDSLLYFVDNVDPSLQQNITFMRQSQGSVWKLGVLSSLEGEALCLFPDDQFISCLTHFVELET
eukprot:9562520-Ditylum_brightwellii.AAC.1